MADTVKITDLDPGDRVRVNDNWNGTVIHTVDNWLGGFAFVDFDHDQGRMAVYPDRIQPL